MYRPRAQRSLPVRLGIAMATLADSGCSRQGPLPAGLGEDSTLVTISAYAEARRAPDIAILSTGVVSLAPDAIGAIRRNTEQMTKVTNAVRSTGITDRDVQTTGVTLNPDYHYVSNQPPRIKGHYASHTVNVTVRDIARLGSLLDALVATGSNQITGPSFDIDNRDALLDEARGKGLDKTA